MIDIHSHLLPGLDDGASDLDTSIKMAEMAYEDGIRGMVCTPHIMPGVYNNTASIIGDRSKQVRSALEERGIGLVLFVGADVHIAPDLIKRLEAGEIPTIAKSRYFLFEPSHHVLTPRIETLASSLIAAGFIPIITHPERLSWIANHYDTFERMNEAGCLIQVTAGSITGDFGKHALYYAEKLIDDGRVDVVATDTHDPKRRPPILSRARDAVAARLDDEEAIAMVEKRPLMILLNQEMQPVGKSNRPGLGEGIVAAKPTKSGGLMTRLMKGTQ